MTPDPLPDDTPTVAEWAETILGTEGPWSVLGHTASGDATVAWAHTPGDLERIAAAATSNTWVAMAARTGVTARGRGGADQCRHICALWADIDIAGPGHSERKRHPADEQAAHAILDAWPLPPTSVLHTGGGLQAFWALAEPLPADEAVALLERWGQWWTDTASAQGWDIDAVFDLPRVMRLPGTPNTKLEHPRPVRHLQWRPTMRFGVDDIEQWLPELRPADTPRHLAPVAGYIGPERPGDAFSAQHTCSEVLERNGWALHHVDQRTGDEHWTRPGKHRRHGASATVYAADGRCVTWTDAIPGLQPRSSLTPFQLLARLEHHGDFGAASRALVRAGYGTPTSPVSLVALGPAPQPQEEPVEPAADDPTMGVLLDWEQFWARDHTDEEWLAEPIIPARRSVSIHAPGGTGKSLLALHIATALATGRPCMGRPAKDPIHVLYLDYEMTADDLAERLETMGYGPDVDLTHLHYALLPALAPLDDELGGQQVQRIAQAVAAELVVVDTYARAVAGDENEADTVRAFYRHTGSRIKAAGIALVRIDHTGKDPDKGARGSSAKRDDVDVVWRIEALQDGPRLRAEKRRMAWVPETVDLQMVSDDILTYRMRPGTEPGWPAGTRETVLDLDELGVPADAPTRVAQAALKAAGRSRRRAVLVAAVRFRKAGGHVAIDVPGPSNDAEPPPGTTVSGDHGQSDRDHGNRETNPQVRAPERFPEPQGTTEPAPYARGGVPLRGTPSQGPGRRPLSAMLLDPDGEAS